MEPNKQDLEECYSPSLTGPKDAKLSHVLWWYCNTIASSLAASHVASLSIGSIRLSCYPMQPPYFTRD